MASPDSPSVSVNAEEEGARRIKRRRIKVSYQVSPKVRNRSLNLSPRLLAHMPRLVSLPSWSNQITP